MINYGPALRRLTLIYTEKAFPLLQKPFGHELADNPPNSSRNLPTRLFHALLVERRIVQQHLEDAAPNLPVGILKRRLLPIMGAAPVGIGGLHFQPGAVIHECIVPKPGAGWIQGLLHQGQQLPVSDAGGAGKEKVEKYPADVGFEKHRRLIKGKGGQSPGSGRTDAGKGLQDLHGVREPATTLFHYPAGEALKRQGPTIIP
jgi:hypothetical protein